MNATRYLALGLLFGLAACSQGGSSAVPATATTLAASQQRHTVHAKLVIKVPRERKRHRRGHYVSPATASLAYSIDGAAQTPVIVATSNPNCSVAGQTYLQCAIPFTVAPGAHTFAFTARDSNGAALSANTNYPFTVKVGTANILAVTLGGVAASLAVLPANTLAVSGSQYGGFRVVGNAPQKFDIVPMDIDGNIIVGPGAPQPVVAATPASMTVTAAPSSAPNTWTLTSTYTTAADPTVPRASKLSVSATPVPNSGGTTITASIPLALYQPWIYVGDDVTGNVLAFDEQGNAKPLPKPIVGLNEPIGLVYDPHNGLVYVASNSTIASSACTTNCITAYQPDGTPYAFSAPTPFGSSAGPGGLAFDPLTNDIYVDYIPITGGGAGSVAAFDEQGNAVALSGTFPGVSSSYALARDSNTDWFYVANCAPPAVNAYSSQGVAKTLPAADPFPNVGNADGITFDPNNNWFYVDNCVTGPSSTPAGPGGGFTAYDEDGNQHTLTGDPQGIPQGWGITFDPYDDLLYVAADDNGNVSSQKIYTFDERGTQQTLGGSAFPGLTWPTQIVVVP
jgi:hypothetical protein